MLCELAYTERATNKRLSQIPKARNPEVELDKRGIKAGRINNGIEAQNSIRLDLISSSLPLSACASGHLLSLSVHVTTAAHTVPSQF